MPVIPPIMPEALGPMASSNCFLADSRHRCHYASVAISAVGQRASQLEAHLAGRRIGRQRISQKRDLTARLSPLREYRLRAMDDRGAALGLLPVFLPAQSGQVEKG